MATPRRAEATNEVIESLRKQLAKAQVEAARPHRRRLPAERTAVTHRFDIAGHEGYITVGLYPDGQPGEIFLKMAKEGSTISGLMDTFATIGQPGAPVRRAAASDLVNKFAHVRFEPSGFTGNPEIPIAKSLVDYIFRWLGSRFLSPEREGLARAPARRRSVAEAPAAGFGAGAAAFRASSPVEAVAPDAAPAAAPEPAPAVEPEPARPTAVATAPAAPAEELAVIATNGHALNAGGNGGSAKPANGNGGAQHRDDHHEPGRHEGGLPDPGGRPQLRRMRLDHGPQRQLLQVPQLREHQRLQLTHVRN